eukprot:1195273-Prorocentrum_minimum.AAC.11
MHWPWPPYDQCVADKLRRHHGDLFGNLGGVQPLRLSLLTSSPLSTLLPPRLKSWHFRLRDQELFKGNSFERTDSNLGFELPFGRMVGSRKFPIE